MPCYEYCEKDIGEMEDRLHAIETRREAIERFNPPVGAAKTVTPDDFFDDWHDRESDLSVRLQLTRWMIFDGETCMASMGVFYDRQEAVAVAKWWAKMGFPEIKRRRALA